MGLDTTHDAWHGAYSAFTRWRNKLAEVAGYTFNVERNLLRPSEPPRPGVYQIDWGNIEATIGRDLMGKWPRIPVRHDGTPDPLLVLLAHSDCEGEIQVDMLAPLAARLEELLPQLAAVEPDGGHIGDWKEKTQQFIDGLRAAADEGVPLEFH